MNILLTSAGRRTYLVNYFKNALNGDGLVYASNNSVTYTLLQADRYVVTPNIYDASYIDFLVDFCKKENISVIIPLLDIDLLVLARNRKRFIESGIQLIVSDEKVTEICNDKWETYKFLKNAGFKQISTFLSIHDVKEALALGEISFPLILKPRWGMGSIGVYQIENKDELMVLYEKLKHDIFKTYLCFESIANQDACVVIQEKIQGKEYGLDVLNDLNGRYVATIAKRKLAMRAGETDIAEIIDNSSFYELGEKLSKELKHIGNLDVDCFLTDDGDICIVELNCRFGGQYPFSHNAGVDFPKQIVEWLNGNPTSANLVTPHIGVISCKDILPVMLKN